MSLFNRGKQYLEAGGKIFFGFLLVGLSYISKWVGKVGAATDWFDTKLIGVITWVIKRNRAEEIRDRIIVNMHILVDEITTPDKPISDTWSAWRANVTNVALQREQRFHRGETFVSLLLAFTAVPIAFLSLSQTTSFALTILFAILAFVLAVAIAIRVAVMDILAFRNPSTRDRDRLKNMWAWNYYILGNSAVLLIILGLAALGNVRQEILDLFVNKIQSIPEQKARGEELNKRELRREVISEVFNIYFDPMDEGCGDD